MNDGTLTMSPFNRLKAKRLFISFLDSFFDISTYKLTRSYRTTVS